jgi:hypothetical protein
MQYRSFVTCLTGILLLLGGWHESEVRSQYLLIVSRISSAVLVQTKGLGVPLCVSMYSRTADSSWRVERDPHRRRIGTHLVEGSHDTELGLRVACGAEASAASRSGACHPVRRGPPAQPFFFAARLAPVAIDSRKR